MRMWTDTVTLPSNWQVASLKALARPTRQWRPASEPFESIRYVDVSAISRDLARIEATQAIRAEEAPSRARKLLEKDDVIYATVRPTLRRIALVDHTDENLIGSTAFCVVRVDSGKALSRYVYYAMRSDPFNAEVALHESGASYPAVRDHHVLNAKIPLPPLDEQRRIAAILWKVQRAIEVQEQLIATVRELKQAAMRQLFTRGLRGEAQKETEIGMVPESWEVVPLGRLGRIGNGSTPKRDNQAFWRGGTTPWLNSGKIHEGVIEAADQFVTDMAVSECHLPIVRAGSILVAITGQGKTLGNVARVNFDTTVNQHLAYLMFSDVQVDADFVRYFLASRYDALRAIGSAGGSTKGAITCADLKQFLVPRPPTLPEQHEIATALQTIDRKLAHHERKRDTLQELFKTLLHELMTGRIRVHELDIDITTLAGESTGGAAT